MEYVYFLIIIFLCSQVKLSPLGAFNIIYLLLNMFSISFFTKHFKNWYSISTYSSDVGWNSLRYLVIYCAPTSGLPPTEAPTWKEVHQLLHHPRLLALLSVTAQHLMVWGLIPPVGGIFKSPNRNPVRCPRCICFAPMPIT